MLKYRKAEKISIKSHSELNEKWIQDRIAEDPSILGLGDLVLKDRERLQPRAGRLDLLLQDADTQKRYEVEIQLGRTDESHIIRTIEYWDIERKRYPQYDHCAVVVAEDITSRFLNVIGLLSGTVPLVAIQMSAIKIGDEVTLVFTTVVDEMTRGLVDEDEETQEVTDRSYWEARSTKAVLGMADEVFEMLKVFNPDLELKYNKFYIGLALGGKTNNFVSLQPRKASLNLRIRLPQSEEIDAELDQAGLDLLDYDKKWRQYRIRLGKTDIKKHDELLRKLFKMAYDESNQ